MKILAYAISLFAGVFFESANLIKTNACKR